MAVLKASKTHGDCDAKRSSPTVALDELNRRLGRRAAAELIRRVDPVLREGGRIATRQAFEGRTLLGWLPAGRVQLVIPEDASKKSGDVSASDVMIALTIADIEAIVRAGRANLTELRAFAPRPQTPPVTAVPRKAGGRRKPRD